MEKPAVAKAKFKFLKLLPRAATAMNFQNHPFSPGRDNANKLKSHMSKGFSGPIVSIIPEEARNKAKSSSFENREPTSPKVSCMGQIKHRKKLAKMKQGNKVAKPSSSSFFKIFGSPKTGKRSGSTAEKSRMTDRREAAPSLSQMKRFASGRESLANFDWTKAQIAPEDMDQRRYYSDEEREESDGEEEEVIIPFSAPIMVGGGRPSRTGLEPRKEINIWKRRTMAQPGPLQLNTLH